MRMRPLLCASSVGLSLVLAACGSSSKPSGAAGTTVAATATSTGATDGAATTTTPQTAADRQAAQLAWRACLTQHGLTLPAVPAAGQGGDQGAQPGDAAGGPNPTVFGGTATTVAGGATATTVAAGGQGGPGPGAGGFGGLNTILNDPANKAAVDACASLRPAFGPGNGGGRGQLPAAYLECLATNGVSVPTTVAGGPAVSIDQTDPAYVAAAPKCASLLPQRGQARTAYNSCLKDNGVNVPTTVAGGPPASIDQNDPAYPAASAKCAPLLPQRGPAQTTTTTNG